MYRCRHASASLYRFALCHQDSSLWLSATGAWNAYFFSLQNTENDIASRPIYTIYSYVEQNRLVIKMFLVVSDDLHSLTSKELEYNQTRIRIHIKNCTATRVWKLHRSVLGQITRSYTSRFGGTMISLHETLRFTEYQTHIDDSAPLIKNYSECRREVC